MARFTKKELKNLANHTTVDWSVFENAKFEIFFDDMDFTATIRPPEKFLDSCYLNRDGSYNIKDRKKTPCDGATTIALDLKMIPISGTGYLFPRINMCCSFFAKYGSTIKNIYIKVGENRYVASLTDVLAKTEKPSELLSSFGSSEETDYSTLPLGFSDMHILREISEGKYPVKIRLGNDEGHLNFTEKDIADVRLFLEVCEQAGVFKQKAFEEEKGVFGVITKFNP